MSTLYKVSFPVCHATQFCLMYFSYNFLFNLRSVCYFNFSFNKYRRLCIKQTLQTINSFKVRNLVKIILKHIKFYFKKTENVKI